MILVDTSAWVEFLRATESEVGHRVESLIASEAPLGTTEVVVMEVLAGARDDVHEQRLRRLMRRCELWPLAGLDDYERAAGIYRRCRKGGETICKLTDCLIAAVAMRVNASVLHRDSDFDAIARHFPLVIAHAPAHPG